MPLRHMQRLLQSSCVHAANQCANLAHAPAAFAAVAVPAQRLEGTGACSSGASSACQHLTGVPQPHGTCSFASSAIRDDTASEQRNSSAASAAIDEQADGQPEQYTVVSKISGHYQVSKRCQQWPLRCDTLAFVHCYIPAMLESCQRSSTGASEACFCGGGGWTDTVQGVSGRHYRHGEAEGGGHQRRDFPESGADAWLKARDHHWAAIHPAGSCDGCSGGEGCCCSTAGQHLPFDSPASCRDVTASADVSPNACTGAIPGWQGADLQEAAA